MHSAMAIQTKVFIVVFLVTIGTYTIAQEQKSIIQTTTRSLDSHHVDLPRRLEDIIVRRLGPNFGNRIRDQSDEIHSSEQNFVLISGNNTSFQPIPPRRRPILRTLRRLFNFRNRGRNDRTNPSSEGPNLRNRGRDDSTNPSSEGLNQFTPTLKLNENLLQSVNDQLNGKSNDNNQQIRIIKSQNIGKLSRAPSRLRPIGQPQSAHGRKNRTLILFNSAEDGSKAQVAMHDSNNINRLKSRRKDQSNQIFFVENEKLFDSSESKELNIDFESSNDDFRSNNGFLNFQLSDGHFADDFDDSSLESPKLFTELRVPKTNPQMSILVLSTDDDQTLPIKFSNDVSQPVASLKQMTSKANVNIPRTNSQNGNTGFEVSSYQTIKKIHNPGKNGYHQQIHYSRRPNQNKKIIFNQPTSLTQLPSYKLPTSHNSNYHQHRTVSQTNRPKDMNSIKTPTVHTVDSRTTSYKFGYEVSEDDLQFGHREERNGNRVDGEYQVLLPNGYRQVVTYYADETGYHPTIRYEAPIIVDPRKVYQTKLAIPLNIPASGRGNNFGSRTTFNLNSVNPQITVSGPGDNFGSGNSVNPQIIRREESMTFVTAPRQNQLNFESNRFPASIREKASSSAVQSSYPPNELTKPHKIDQNYFLDNDNSYPLSQWSNLIANNDDVGAKFGSETPSHTFSHNTHPQSLAIGKTSSMDTRTPKKLPHQYTIYAAPDREKNISVTGLITEPGSQTVHYPTTGKKPNTIRLDDIKPSKILKNLSKGGAAYPILGDPSQWATIASGQINKEHNPVINEPEIHYNRHADYHNFRNRLNSMVLTSDENSRNFGQPLPRKITESHW